jgi:hypothetical protein
MPLLPAFLLTLLPLLSALLPLLFALSPTLLLRCVTSLLVVPGSHFGLEYGRENGCAIVPNL